MMRKRAPIEAKFANPLIPALKKPRLPDPLVESFKQAERAGLYEVKWSKRRKSWVKSIKLD